MPIWPSQPYEASNHSREHLPGPGNDLHIPVGPTPVVVAPKESKDAHGHAQKSSYQHGTTALGIKNVGLFRLPEELLHAIAVELCGSKDILQLSLTNKQLNTIAHDAMLNKLVVSSNKIHKLLEFLTKRPECMTKVLDVDLGDYGCACRMRCTCVITVFEREMLGSLARYIALNCAYPINTLQEWITNCTTPPLWGRKQAFFLDLLVAACPNIKSIAMELPESADAFEIASPPSPLGLSPSTFPARNPEMKSFTPFRGRTLQVMKDHLQTFTIAVDSRWKGRMQLEFLSDQRDADWRKAGRPHITFPGFTMLRRLDMPMDILGQPRNIVFQDPTSIPTVSDKDIERLDEVQQKVLPLTLKYLHLRNCNQWTFAFLQKVNELPARKTNLQPIEFFSSASVLTWIKRCYAEDSGQLDYLQVLREIHRGGIKTSFYCGPKEVEVNLRKELYSLRVLSRLEVYHLATINRVFSELNISASLRRRASFIEHQLFMRHVRFHFDLINSTTFLGKLWKDVAFFHGRASRTRFPTPVFPPRLSNRPRKREIKRRLSPILGIYLLNHVEMVKANSIQILIHSLSNPASNKPSQQYRMKSRSSAGPSQYHRNRLCSHNKIPKS
jgi:hypothetical protein